MWLAFFSVLSVVISIPCALAAIYAAQSAIRERASLAQRVRSAELRLSSINDWQNEQAALMESLAQSAKMTRVRKATTHATSERNSDPDPYTNPDEWRKSINRKLNLRGLS